METEASFESSINTAVQYGKWRCPRATITAHQPALGHPWPDNTVLVAPGTRVYRLTPHLLWSQAHNTLFTRHFTHTVCALLYPHDHHHRRKGRISPQPHSELPQPRRLAHTYPQHVVGCSGTAEPDNRCMRRLFSEQGHLSRPSRSNDQLGIRERACEAVVALGVVAELDLPSPYKYPTVAAAADLGRASITCTSRHLVRTSPSWHPFLLRWCTRRGHPEAQPDPR